MTLDEIKAQYPDVDINTNGGSDTYQDGLPVVERYNIAVVIKHPTEESYLLARWKKSDWTGFLTGGIEEGVTLEEITKQEIQEETGYKNISNIQSMDCVSHGLFFHPVKNVNRLAHYQLMAAQLTDLEKDEVSEEEKSIAEFNWFSKEEVLDLLTRDDMKTLWKFYIGQ